MDSADHVAINACTFYMPLTTATKYIDFFLIMVHLNNYNNQHRNQLLKIQHALTKKIVEHRTKEARTLVKRTQQEKLLFVHIHANNYAKCMKVLPTLIFNTLMIIIRNISRQTGTCSFAGLCIN